MSISASMVKELRERTGSGMMECKKALVETNGDLEAAIELMRKTGLAKADKKAGRIAAEGLVVAEVSEDGKRAAITEINSETDFVAKGDDFVDFAKRIGQHALTSNASDMNAFLEESVGSGGKSVSIETKELIAKVGENISVRRFESWDVEGALGIYRHGSRIGVMVELKGGNAEVAKDIAMHVAASRPVCVNADEVPKDVLEREKEIFAAQARESGKPENIIEKMIEGRIKKYVNEITLLGQPFVKNPDISVGQLAKDAGAEVVRFVRFEVGEGIEKKEENFADEVMAQVRGE